MNDPAETLKLFQPSTGFFVGIDSDGCVFDSMEIKHKECFTPMFIKHFNLQAVSKYARETWDFVNLYSKTRGVNRFPALSRSLELLGKRTEVRARQIEVKGIEALDDWIARENKLGNATLNHEVENGNKGLELVKQWSDAVNAMVKDIVYGVPPFPKVDECLKKIQVRADAMVISQTPVEALQREWKENQIDAFVKVIAGQEMGTKTDHLRLATSGKYDSDRVLMIGDAPGDYKAAKANQALFFPIVPGREESSWQLLLDEGLDRFFNGTFAGQFENELFAAFDSSLPEHPKWSTL